MTPELQPKPRPYGVPRIPIGFYQALAALDSAVKHSLTIAPGFFITNVCIPCSEPSIDFFIFVGPPGLTTQAQLLSDAKPILEYSTLPTPPFCGDETVNIPCFSGPYRPGSQIYIYIYNGSSRTAVCNAYITIQPHIYKEEYSEQP